MLSLAAAAGTVLGANFFAFQAWAAAFACVLWKIVEVSPSDLVSNSLAAVGQFSYSLYAIHVPVILFFHAYLFDGVRQASILPSIGIWLLAIAAAYVFYRVVEYPSLLALRQV
jgi:peptidoglycan/LPS O-acetylase OafA/YrhL